MNSKMESDSVRLLQVCYDKNVVNISKEIIIYRVI